MVVGRGDDVGSVVEPAGHERAHDGSGHLKGLVHRRGLVLAPGDRFEVGDVEGVGVEMPVPGDDVERVVIERVDRRAVADEDEHVGRRPVIEIAQLGGPPEVPLPVGGVLEELPLVGDVPLGKAHSQR